VWVDRRSGVAGYCVVIWNRGHVVELGDLDAADLSGFWEEVTAVGRAVSAAFAPKKVNYQVLGNSVPHLHVHVLPRYEDDPAPGGPLPWSEVIAGRFDEIEIRRQADLVAGRLRSRPTASRTTVTIDDLTVDDLDLVEELWRELYRHHRAVAPHLDAWVTDEDTSWLRRRARYRGWLESDRGLLLGARSTESEVVAYAMVEMFPPPGPSRGTYQVPAGAELQTLSVRQHLRGTGIGSELFEAVRHRLRDRGVQVVTIAWMSGNDDAERFYERSGSIPWVTSVMHRTT
jgi:diadenosine tetraphosphate (Ap4A) HIT family hydrolase/GNAT superfamily N-acetyltransferase